MKNSQSRRGCREYSAVPRIIDHIKTAHSGYTTVQADTLTDPWTEAWRQRLIKLALVCADVVLAFIIWELTCVAEIFWAPGYVTGFVIAIIVPITLVWVGLRASQGLYPGY